MSEQLSSSSIAESLWWVISARLAGIRKPTEEDLPLLSTFKVDALVSVLNDDSNLTLYKQHKIPYLWVPIEGGHAPTLAQLKQLKAFVDKQNAQNNAVAIHCSNGLRRTGTVLAALLIQQGIDYEGAMAVISAANPAVNLRENQTSFLKGLS